MDLKQKHEAAFHEMAGKRKLFPGAENFIIDAASGLVSRATVWLHGAVWFVDHFDRNSPVYRREYDWAVRQPQTHWVTAQPTPAVME